MSPYRAFSLALTLLLFFVATLGSQAEFVYRPGEGWSDETSGNTTTTGSAADQLELGHSLEAEGKKEDALKVYKILLRRWPLSFSSPEAEYRVGKLLEEKADFLGAFKAFQVMVDKYPSSTFFTQGLEEQYRIANLYLAGEPQRIWKVPLGPSMEKAISLFQQVIKNAPFGPQAAQCQFNIGLADEKERKYSDAVDAYEHLLDHYPTSPLCADAQYQIGYAWMRSAVMTGYDQRAAQKAQEAFQDFMVKYPDSEKYAQAQIYITKLSHRETQATLDIAKFYETQKDPRAAFIYYNEVIREDPDSDQATIAKKRIQDLRPVVEKLPGGIPSTPPPSVASSPSGDIPVDASNEPSGGSLPSGNPPPNGSSPLPGATPDTASSATSSPASPSSPESAPATPASPSPSPTP